MNNLSVPRKNDGLKPVDEDKTKQNLEKSPYVDQFVKQGLKLLENTNRPNIITVEQFAPFIALYKFDEEKYENDGQYKEYITRLTQQFRVSLSINLHEPILVVRSKEDQTVVYHLNRVFTRIKPDALLEGNSAKQNLSELGPRVDKKKRDDLMVGAIMTDIVNANNTPEQLDRFRQVRQESALINKRFVEQNLSHAKREELLSDLSPPETAQSDLPSIMFDDDDD